ncbi:DeoR/GlpR family DNA-binding transcription regulator [Herbiconiux solani]|uniref:DeoR/GlpR family DNA-binding transcription regulator n=1 Tax=Herbiconiux solani TaxID=661329 RepID=UPI000826FD93|nr:DeoR/GlpR family DNA-binding transcription regulator [Herbiconiux solani]
MYLEERRRLIIAKVQTDGRIDATQIAAELDVTTETVRKDLVSLERQGFLTRTHGGAISVQRLGFEPETSVRQAVMSDAKLRIAEAAMSEVPADGSIIIDGGTTTALMPRFFSVDANLHVVTNSLQIQNALSDRPNTTVMAVGGVVRPVSQCSVGPWAVNALVDVRVDVAFIGVNGFSLDHGLTTSDQAEAEVKRQMMKSARQVVLLADSSKLGADYFHRFGTLADVDVIITDSGVDDELAADLRTEGHRLVIA